MPRPNSQTTEKQVRNLAFEYIIAQAIYWYYENSEKQFKNFNEQNRFNARQAMLLPFFISSANGSFDDMFDLFKEFYALKDGPISESILNSAYSDELKFFNLNIRLPEIPVKIKDIDSYNNNWNNLKEAILNYTISDNGEDIQFREFCFKNGHTKLIYQAIEKSIKAIKSESNSKFIHYSVNEMSYIARQYRSWLIAFEIYNKKDQSRRSKVDLIIDKDLASKDRRIYSPLVDQTDI